MEEDAAQREKGGGRWKSRSGGHRGAWGNSGRLTFSRFFFAVTAAIYVSPIKSTRWWRMDGTFFLLNQ